MRTIELTIPPTRTADLLDELRALQPATLRLQRDGSLQPPGDVITVQVTNDRLRDVMKIADRCGLGRDDDIAMGTSEPLSVVTPAFSRMTRESGATTWEELELAMGEDSTMTGDRTVVMLLAGVIAGLGILGDQLHTVIGAMVIAPGFQPFARVVLGVVNRSGAWHGGLRDVGRGYGALMAGAAVAAVLGLVLGAGALDAGHGRYLGSGELVAFWTSVSWTGIAVGGFAAVCGGILVALNRTVLTAGVMVALALVPTAALVPMGVIAGDLPLAGDAAVRFLLEAALVLAGTLATFLFKRRSDRRAGTA